LASDVIINQSKFSFIYQLHSSPSMATWKAYDVKAKKNVVITSPKAVKLKNGMWAVQGKSPLTGNKVTRIVGKTKPSV